MFLYGALILKWVRAKVANETDQNEIVTVVLFRVIRSIKGFKPTREGSFRAWLRTITNNEVVRHWQNRDRATQTSGASLIDTMEDRIDKGELRFEPQAQVLQLLRKELGREEVVDAFIRREVNGETYADIAEDMGKKEGTVRTWVCRAKKRLKQHLTPDQF